MKKIENFSAFKFKDWNHISYEGKQISHWWGKTFFYSDDKNQLFSETISPIGRLFRRFFKKHPEISRENLWNYLKEKKIVSEEDPCPEKSKFRKIVAEKFSSFSQKVEKVKKGLSDTHEISDEEMIQTFEQGMDKNSIIDGKSALFLSLLRGRLKVFDYLLKNGADVNPTQEKTGLVANTPLHQAISSRLEEQAIALLEKGADPRAEDAYKNTALHNAISNLSDDPTIRFPGEGNKERNPKKVIKALIECHQKNQYSLDKSNKNGRTPLYFACREGDSEVVGWLLDAGANPNALGMFGEPPLSLAIRNNNIAIVKLLLEKKADPNLVIYAQQWSKSRYYPYPYPTEIRKWSNNFETALLQSLRNPSSRKDWKPDVTMMQLLIDYQADVNQPRKQDGYTPLHRAVEEGYREAVEFLLNHGADKTIRNRAGKTALDIAREKNNQEIIDLLEKNT